MTSRRRNHGPKTSRKNNKHNSLVDSVSVITENEFLLASVPSETLELSVPNSFAPKQSEPPKQLPKMSQPKQLASLDVGLSFSFVPCMGRRGRLIVTDTSPSTELHCRPATGAHTNGKSRGRRARSATADEGVVTNGDARDATTTTPVGEQPYKADETNHLTAGSSSRPRPKRTSPLKRSPGTSAAAKSLSPPSFTARPKPRRPTSRSCRSC